MTKTVSTFKGRPSLHLKQFLTEYVLPAMMKHKIKVYVIYEIVKNIAVSICHYIYSLINIITVLAMVHHDSQQFELYGKIGVDRDVKKKIQHHYIH